MIQHLGPNLLQHLAQMMTELKHDPILLIHSFSSILATLSLLHHIHHAQLEDDVHLCAVG